MARHRSEKRRAAARARAPGPDAARAGRPRWPRRRHADHAARPRGHVAQCASPSTIRGASPRAPSRIPPPPGGRAATRRRPPRRAQPARAHSANVTAGASAIGSAGPHARARRRPPRHTPVSPRARAVAVRRRRLRRGSSIFYFFRLSRSTRLVIALALHGLREMAARAAVGLIRPHFLTERFVAPLTRATPRPRR